MGSSDVVKFSWVYRAEEFFLRITSIPASTNDLPWTFNSPKQRAKYPRAFNEVSGAAQPEIFSMCRVRAPPAPPLIRKTSHEQGPNDETWNFTPTRVDEFPGHAKYRGAVIRKSAGTSPEPYAGAGNFQTR